jgi:hypothetical protein
MIEDYGLLRANLLVHDLKERGMLKMGLVAEA